MKLITKLLAVGAALTFLGGAAVAEEHMDRAIKARKAVMQLRVFELSQLGAMAKGKVAYDAKSASAAANNLKTVVSINMMAMWPKGSDNGAMADKTNALANIWTEFPKVSEANNALVAAVDNLANVAGKDLPSLQGGIGAVGKACGGCHKQFRAEMK
jgi:cytochrome c556